MSLNREFNNFSADDETVNSILEKIQEFNSKAKIISLQHFFLKLNLNLNNNLTNIKMYIFYKFIFQVIESDIVTTFAPSCVAFLAAYCATFPEPEIATVLPWKLSPRVANIASAK